RRDYFAYIGAWGFWLSLITAPLIIAVLTFAPVLLARAEPPRTLAILAERADDSAHVTAAFEADARRAARGDIRAYLDTTAPGVVVDALAAFDAAPDRGAAIAAARDVVVQRAPGALRAFPSPSPRYIIVGPPAPTIEAMRPYLAGTQTLPNGEALYGALNLRRDAANTPVIEYWGVNLSHEEPSAIARRAMRLAMQREA